MDEAKATEKAKASVRATVSSLLPSKLFGTKESDEKTEIVNGNDGEASSVNKEMLNHGKKSVVTASADAAPAEEAMQGENLTGVEVLSNEEK